MKLSIVIPVYNGANYICHSAQAVLQETETELELLMIDDGSEDDTFQVLTALAEADSRVRVFQTDNQGQSAARNIGLRKATGDYITFLDADDKILWDGVRSMTAAAEKEQWDVVCGNYNQVSRDAVWVGLTGVPSGEVKHDNRKDSIYGKIKTRSVFGYCWNKLYRIAFLREHDLYFDDVRKVFMEDSLFNHKVFSRAPRFYYCDVLVYQYYIRHLSSSRKREASIAQLYSNMLDEYSSYLKRNKVYQENLDLLVPLMMRVFCWALAREVSLEGELRKDALTERVTIFSSGTCFREVISDRKNIRTLRQVPSGLQRMVYRVCFRILNRGWGHAIPRLFELGDPLLKAYLKYKQIK